uniref:Uncharacterized protein n=1 Tax=Setaria italica TaxID=4555 RepID=K3Z1T6_SETIT
MVASVAHLLVSSQSMLGREGQLWGFAGASCSFIFDLGACGQMAFFLIYILGGICGKCDKFCSHYRDNCLWHRPSIFSNWSMAGVSESKQASH